MTDSETNTVDNLAHPFLQVHVVTPGDLITTEVPEAAQPKVIPISANSGRPKQLSSVDAQLLDMETRTTPMHVGAVIMLASDQPLDIRTRARDTARRFGLVAGPSETHGTPGPRIGRRDRGFRVAGVPRIHHAGDRTADRLDQTYSLQGLFGKA
ncbi:hypothetical protein [Nocardia sp.]|uniref:hypothetical protein n=1 Tax=Nocardia sp. TaxID=1821 RepID=UPI00262EEFAB|nr:hypothetical protein [Nocardia sp.]